MSHPQQQGPPPGGYYAPPPAQMNPYGYPPAGYPAHYMPPPPQPVAPAAPGVPYIGARISLISNTFIRYEGTLYTIDTKESTVALQNVRCFGTEHRGTDGQGGGGFVPPSNDIYEFIIFGGRDIADLAVLQPEPMHQMPPQQQMQQPPQQQFNEPPPAQPTQPQEQPPQQQPAEPVQPAPQQPQQQQQAPTGRQPRGERSQRGGRQQPGGAKHTVRMINDETAAPQQAAASSSAPVSEPAQPQAAVPAPQQIAPAAAPVDGSFDFQNSNARFEKLDDAAAAAASAAVPSYDLPAADAGLDVSGFPVVTKKYDKSKSFFDELTTDKGTRSAASGRDMRRVDVDTFGSEAQNFRSKHGRGGRGPRGPRGPRGGQQPQQGGQQQQGGAWRQNPQ